MATMTWVGNQGYITTNDIPEGAAASTTTPKMDGTASVGTELAFARGDHRHPSDTTKVDKIDGKGLSTNDFNATYKGYVDNLVSSTATTKNAHVHGNIGSGGTVTATTTTATNKIATIGASDNKIYSFTMTYTNGVLNIGG
jgi:hypothetical protein